MYCIEILLNTTQQINVEVNC